MGTCAHCYGPHCLKSSEANIVSCPSSFWKICCRLAYINDRDDAKMVKLFNVQYIVISYSVSFPFVVLIPQNGISFLSPKRTHI